jgi:superfamily II DNA or RNA helicase
VNSLPLFPSAPDFTHAKFPPARSFQERAHQALREGFRNGHRRQLLVAPTGAGKTYIGLRVAHEALSKDKRACFICDRTALINQTSARADDYGLTDHAIVQADHWRRDTTMPLQIASIQTLAARGFWPQADVLIIDEAHTQHSAWVEYIKTTNAAVIGLTATPCSKGLGLSFTNMVNAATMHELTTEGVLVPMRILSCMTPDMTGAATSGGEWTNKAAAERELQIVGDVVAEWVKYGEGRKTIAFGPDIAYCLELVKRFNEAGIGAATYTSETKDDERLALLEEFVKPNSGIRILVSVEALAKGFDVQDIGCVIDARPLRKSLSTAIQMWGRGLRSSPNTGKQDCLLLDHSGNIRRFYDDFTDVYFNGFQTLDLAEKLDGVVRKDEKEYDASGCPKCGHTPFRRRCMKCAYEKESASLTDSSAGEMHEIRIGKKVIASNKQDLWNQLCTYAKQYVNSEKRSGWAWHKFQDLTGERLPRSFPRFEDAPVVAISSGTLGKLKSMRIAYAKGRRAA